jgi:hypothetical protein
MAYIKPATKWHGGLTWISMYWRSPRARKRQERYRALEKALAASRKIRWTKVAVRDR